MGCKTETPAAAEAAGALASGSVVLWRRLVFDIAMWVRELLPRSPGIWKAVLKWAWMTVCYSSKDLCKRLGESIRVHDKRPE